MLAQSEASSDETAGETTAQIRDASAIPDVITCTTQAVQHTEVDLTSAVQNVAAVAASG